MKRHLAEHDAAIDELHTADAQLQIRQALLGWLCLTSHRQRGHLETAPPFTVPCEVREAR